MEKHLENPVALSNPSQPQNRVGDSDELLEDLTTTIDPSHIINLIRQLLPEPAAREKSLSPKLKSQIKSSSVSVVRDTGSEDRRVVQVDKVPDDLPARNQDNSAFHSECLAETSGERDSDSPVNQVDISDADLTRKRHREDPVQPDLGTGSQGYLGNLGVQITFQESTQKSNQVVLGQEHLQAPESGRCEPQNGLDVVGGDVVVGDLEEDPKEEAGCLLWDLAANECHAEFLVQNQIMEVLLAILQSCTSNRIREICLGILGNLACHAGPVKSMVGTTGLVDVVVNQLFVDDPPSLTETCRLLSAGLHSKEAVSWVAAVDMEEVLGRIMWMATNTTHSQLLEKSTELLLAMVDGSVDAASVLLPGLLRLGLPELLTDLLASELTSVIEGSTEHGDIVLDTVLQITEALSLLDECAKQLAANRKLFSLACQVICESRREEIGPSAITATVLVANLLAEDMSLIQELSKGVLLTDRLLALLPGASDDPGARNALWSILGRIFRTYMPVSKSDDCGVAEMAAVLSEGSLQILEDLKEHGEEDREEDKDRESAGHDVLVTASRGLEVKLLIVSNMISILERCQALRSQLNGHSSQLLSAVHVACSSLGDYMESQKPRKQSVPTRPHIQVANVSA